MHHKLRCLMAELYHLKTATMKQFCLLCIFLFSAALSAEAQTMSWTPVSSGTQKKLLSVSFGNNATGYISGADGLLLKTRDGGRTWNPVVHTGMTLSANADDIIHVNFVNADTGYAVVSNFANPLYRGALYQTTDGGTTWTQQAPGNIAVNCSYFFDAQNSIVAGAAFFAGYTISKRTAGTWGNYHTLSLSPLDFIWDLDFYDANSGIAVGTRGYAMRTSNGGVSWDTINTHIDTNINSVRFLNNHTIVAATDNAVGGIIISYDTGHTWQSEPSTQTFFYPFMKSIVASRRDSFIAAGRTFTGIEGFLIWKSGLMPGFTTVTQPLNEVAMANDSIAYAVGDSGLIVTNRMTPTGIMNPGGQLSLAVYPNPSEGQFHVSAPVPVALYVYDLTGKRVYAAPGMALQHHPDIRKLPAGTYVLKVIASDGQQQQQCIVRQ